MSPRIGIIGAGPGGLSLAKLLTDRGFADVTVLEKLPRVGGKSLTVHHDGLGHELGTCYVADGYVTAKRWMKEAGMTIHPLERHFIHDRQGRLVPFKDFVEADHGLVGTGAQSLAYSRAWFRFHAWDLRGNADHELDDRGRPWREQVARPFREWLEERELDTIARFAMRTMTIMGYGAMDNVPTLILSAVRMSVGEPIPGWQHLWIHLAGHLDVRLDQAIRAVVRRDGGYEVHTSQGALDFDHLVLTCALDEAARWFPFDDVERQAWGVDGDVVWHEYVTTLVHAESWFQDADTRSFEAHAHDGAATDQGHLLVARRTGDKSAAALARAKTRRDLYVCYQYGAPDRSDAELLATLVQDLERDGAKQVRALEQHRWKYAPQLRPEAIRAGALARMERQQGKNRLWVTGATASHEAVDNILDYNERLVERMIAAFRGRDPSDPALLDDIADRYRLRVDDK